jgi:hypothetical protein
VRRRRRGRCSGKLMAHRVAPPRPTPGA